MSSGQLESVNPATGKPIKSYAVHTTAQAETILKKARKAGKAWALKTPEERSELLLAIAASIRNVLQDAALTATREMGKPIAQSKAELEKCAKTMEWYAANGPKALKNVPVSKSAKRKAYISYRPLGTVLAVMPWNFPYWQVFRAMAPILLSGNAMVLKHASNVTGCALMIEKILKSAGAPADLFRVLLLPSAEMEAVIASPEIAAVTFTGSTSAGRKIAATAAAHLKKQVLELGGSDAYVVLDDADIATAASICLEARMINTGQSCVAAKRFIVTKKNIAAFTQMLQEKIKDVSFGNPEDERYSIGSMAREDLRNDLHKQVEASVAKGAKLLAGGVIPDGPGAFYPPTLLAGVRKGMPAYEEELFGPVAVIIEAKDEEDALRIANDSEYGLGSALFSKDRKRAEMLAEKFMDAGSCFVNEAVHSDPSLPFGGIKHSGYGRELSQVALHEFVNIKTVVVS